MQPRPLADVDIVFPTEVSHLLPAYSEVPEEFRRDRNQWVQLAEEWFYSGLSRLVLTAKPSIDKSAALRHLQAVLGSFEPKHKHKIAGVAYLLSQWFEPPQTEAK